MRFWLRPVQVLGEVSAERLATLAKDRRFLRRLQDVVDDLQEYMSSDLWYQSLGADAPKSIAYFSAEFGITEVLPQYSGGLGILAGDHLKAASDLGVPPHDVLLRRPNSYTAHAQRQCDQGIWPRSRTSR